MQDEWISDCLVTQIKKDIFNNVDNDYSMISKYEITWKKIKKM